MNVQEIRYLSNGMADSMLRHDGIHFAYRTIDMIDMTTEHVYKCKMFVERQLEWGYSRWIAHVHILTMNNEFRDSLDSCVVEPISDLQQLHSINNAVCASASTVYRRGLYGA